MQQLYVHDAVSILVIDESSIDSTIVLYTKSGPPFFFCSMCTLHRILQMVLRIHIGYGNLLLGILDYSEASLR